MCSTGRLPRWQNSAHKQLFQLFCKCLLLAHAFIVATLPAVVLPRTFFLQTPRVLALKTVTAAPHFTCSTTSSDPPRQSGIHIYHTLHFPISISILKLSFLLLACLPSLVSSSHVWVGDYHFQNPHHYQEKVCLMGSSLLMHGERPLSATISSSGLHLLTLSTLGGHTLTLTPATFLRTKK